ncbi:10523_t:CDS:2, partial [Entrophospora sp. SA101]
IKIIKEIIENAFNNYNLFKEFGLNPPKGILLYGPSGTGKTLIFNAVASETNSYKIFINGPEVISKYYGETESKLKSIFEKALEINPHNSRLLGTYLKCCEKNWDVPKLLTKWDQVLKDNSTNISLWIQYLDFRQTNLVSFTVSQCLQVFEDCLHVLRKAVLVTLDRS